MNKRLILFCAFLLSAGMLISEDVSTVEKHAAECSAGNQEACKKLADIAKNDKDSDIREAAVRKLNDQATLAYIAKNDKKIYVRVAAFEKLTDQSVLAEIAKNDSESSVRMAAANILTDDASLSFIAKNDADRRVREAAVKKLPIDHKLRKIVLAKKEDVKKLEDQEFLADIAKSAVDESVRLMAVENLTDQVLLADIALNLKDMNFMEDYFTRMAAVKKITDQILLAHIMKTAWRAERDRSIREEAFHRLTDPVLMADIAKNAEFGNVRELATLGLTDQIILADIAKTDKDEDVRQAAVWKLKDQTVLTDIAKTDKDENVRIKAIEKITSRKVLAEIAMNDEDLKIRSAAVKNERLTDDINMIRKIYSVKIKTIGFDKKYKEIEQLFQKTAVNLLNEMGLKVTENTDSSDGVVIIIAADIDSTLRESSLVKQTVELPSGRVIREEPIYNEGIDKITGSIILTEADELIYSKFFLIEGLPSEEKVPRKDMGLTELRGIVAKSHENLDVRLAAIQSLTDFSENWLADIAKNDNECKARKAAVKKLTYQTVLEDIAENDENAGVRREAVLKLKDKELLADIADDDEDVSVRKAAERRLKELQGK